MSFTLGELFEDTVSTRASYDEVNNNILDTLATFVAIVFSVLVVNVLDSNNCFSVILFDNRWRPAMDACCGLF